MKISPICDTATVAGTVSAKGGDGGAGGGRGSAGSGNGGNGSNGNAITIESDGDQTISGTLTAAKGLKGTGGAGGARTSTSGTGSVGGSGSAGTDGTDGPNSLTTSGANIDTTNASITPAATTGISASPFCAVATASLTVIKTVVGGGASSEFTMTVTGTAVPGGSTSFAGADSPGTTLSDLSPGDYSVDESGPDGYIASFSADCSGSLAAGDSKTCTITNTKRPTLTVIKTVVNGGTVTSADFEITVAGTAVDGGTTSFGGGTRRGRRSPPSAPGPTASARPAPAGACSSTSSRRAATAPARWRLATSRPAPSPTREC